MAAGRGVFGNNAGCVPCACGRSANDRPGRTGDAVDDYGTTEKRCIDLILHDASKPAIAVEDEWKPKGLCVR